MVWGYPYPAERRHTLSERSYAHTVHLAVEDEEEEVLDAAGRREMDLCFLESQVPGCTRELAEQAYAQGCEDVERALPLARVTALLADREAMTEFIVEQVPNTSPTEADFSIRAARGDVINAVTNLQHEAGRQRNQLMLGARSRQRLRMRTVFMLALLYRERYGQLERVAEEALAERARVRDLTPFRTADGSEWTHTRDEGWQRREPAPQQTIFLGRAVRATEQLADAAEARGHAQTATRARRTADGMRVQLADNDQQAPPSPPSPQSPLPPALPNRTTPQRNVNESETWSSYGWLTIYHERNLAAQTHSPRQLHAHALESQYRELRDQDTNTTDSEDEPPPPTLAAASPSSSEAEEDDGTETPTAGAYARPRPFVRAAVRIHPQNQRWEVAKRNLRIVQEQLDTEMASATQGVVMSEGGYIAMMNAIKVLWEQLSPGPLPVEVN
tara:strand:- start:1034 stop:2368 length:1335 start_codon:yes stop_codon:yes gene_type:complete